MTWCKFYVKDDLSDFQANTRVRLEFSNIWIQLGCPKGLMLFRTRGEPIGGTTYYAPQPTEQAMRTFLERYSAELCDRPNESDIIAVVGGSSEGWQYLFVDNA